MARFTFTRPIPFDLAEWLRLQARPGVARIVQALGWSNRDLVQPAPASSERVILSDLTEMPLSSRQVILPLRISAFSQSSQRAWSQWQKHWGAKPVLQEEFPVLKEQLHHQPKVQFHLRRLVFRRAHLNMCGGPAGSRLLMVQRQYHLDSVRVYSTQTGMPHDLECEHFPNSWRSNSDHLWHC